MPPKILVIDDDTSILYGIKLALEYSGYRVEITTEGKETYERAHLARPDLILLDVMLIGTDGRTITKNLKNQEETNKIPIVLMSANHDIHRTILSCGADDFIPKPFGIDTLIRVIERNLT